MTPEGRIKDYLRKAVAREGGKVRFIRWLGRRNAPDTLVYWTFPQAALVETKKPKDDARLAQAREHRLLRADGWRVYVCDTPEDIESMIKEVKHATARPA